MQQMSIAEELNKVLALYAQRLTIGNWNFAIATLRRMLLAASLVRAIGSH